jgi:hypothetical protein
MGTVREVVAHPAFCVLDQPWVIATKNSPVERERFDEVDQSDGHRARIFIASSWNRNSPARVGAAA